MLECAACGKLQPEDGWFLGFKELEGQPIVCIICVFKKLTGKDAEWLKR